MGSALMHPHPSTRAQEGKGAGGATNRYHANVARTTQVNQSGTRPAERRENPRAPAKTRSLQVRLALLVVMITSPALLLLGFLSLYAADRDVEHVLQDRGERAAEWLDDTFGHLDLRNAALVQGEIDRLTRVRSGIRDIRVFARDPDSGALTGVAARAHLAAFAPSIDDDRAARNDISVKRKDPDGWDIAAPLHSGDKVVGIAHAEVLLPEREASLVVDARVYLALAALGALGLTGLALVFALDRAIGQPVEQLVGVMERARQGDLTAQVAVTHLDEFGWLGENFNRMLRKLKENDERLSRFAKELETKVALATVELASKNDELARANHRLFEAQRALGNSERLASLGQLASQIAHEIGTPLNSIYGHIQLLAADEIPDAAKKRVAIVESQVERLTKIIENVLRTLRLPDAQLRELDVNPTLAGIAAFMQPVAESRKIRLSLKLQDGLPQVYADSRQLEQVLLNLITNAFDAMPDGGTLTIESDRAEKDVTTTSSMSSSGERVYREEPEHVLIRVRDSGIGIPPENLHRIFEPFFTTKAPGTGTGLGLPICKQILRTFRGSLSVESEGAGKGAVFIMQLPALRRSASPAQPLVAAAEPLASTESDSARLAQETLTTDSSASDQKGDSARLAIPGPLAPPTTGEV
jgi:signal transduction histidine kinase